MNKNALNFVRSINTIITILFDSADKKITLRIICTFALILFTRITFLGSLYFFQIIVDHINIIYSNKNNYLPIAVLPMSLLISYLILRFFSESSSTLATVLVGSLAQNSAKNQALRVFKHLQRLSSSFYSQIKTGEILGALERSIRGIEFIYQSTIAYLLPNLIELIVILGYFLFLFQIQLTLILLVGVITYSILNLYSIKNQLIHRLKLNKAYLTANHIALESLLNYELIHCFNLEPLKFHEYEEAISEYKKNNIESNTITALFNFAKNGIMLIFSFGMIVWSAQQVLNHQISIGQFMLINTLLYQLFQPLTILSNFYGQIRQSLVDIHQMLKITNQKIEIIDYPNNIPIDSIKNNIIFHNVSFFYNPEKTVLNNISLTIPQGKITAIVGESGSGKSTLSRLLLRLHNITSGKIILDYINIQDITLSSLRSIISMVPQEVHLFNQSILYNLTLGQPNISIKRIIKACKKSGIYAYIKQLPEQFNTPVGERGLCLSGGEKQRIGIARALLQDSPILILDEATSALDIHHEQLILKNILTDTTKTILIISHRLQSIQHADNIIVLHDGSVIEQGMHDNLMKNKGIYYHLWIKQYKNNERSDQPIVMAGYKVLIPSYNSSQRNF